jgi:MFS transporter, DHA1 family, multidrug resistance protein
MFKPFESRGSLPSSAQQANGVLLWMCAIIAVTQLGFGAIVPVLPLYAKSFGVSVSAIGFTIAIYGLARFVTAIPCGRLSDFLGRRPTLALGGLISGLGNIWCALASQYPEFLVARFVSGAGASMVLTMGSVILADISPPERRGRMMATYQGVFLFSFGIGPFPGGLLAEHFGLAAPFYVYAFASVIGALLAWFAIPETRNFSSREFGAKIFTPLPFLAQVQILTKNKGFMLVSLIGLAAAVSRTGAIFALVPILAAQKLGLSTGQIGSGLGIACVVGLISSYPAGAVADRYGRKIVIVPSTLLNGVSMAVFALVPTVTGFMIAFLLWGIASAVNGSAPAAYAADHAPLGMNAMAMSSFRMLADLGYVIGPVVLGLVADWKGAEFALWCAALLTIFIGLLFAKLAPETLVKNA